MQRLVEHVKVAGSQVRKLKLNESTVRMQEGELDVSAAFEVPIWRIGQENLNKRTYGNKVAEKVVRESKVTMALGDHPDDEGSVWNIVAVAKNPKIRDGILWAEAYFVDDAMAKKVDKIVEYGGEIGLSSSAYGDVDDDGNVLEEGFEIERYFDLVLEPSYQVYIGKESTRIAPNSHTESVDSGDIAQAAEVEGDSEEEDDEKKKKRKNQPSEEGSTISTGKATKEQTMQNLDKLHEANFRLNVETLLKNAEEKTSLVERKRDYEKISAFLPTDGMDDLRETVNSRIADTSAKIEELAEKGVETDDLRSKAEEATSKTSELEEALDKQKKVYESKIASLQKRYERANETINSLREKVEDAEKEAKMEEAQKNGRVDASHYADLARAYREALAEIEKLKERLDKSTAESTETRHNHVDESEIRKVHSGLKIEEDDEEEDEAFEEDVDEDDPLMEAEDEEDEDEDDEMDDEEEDEDDEEMEESIDLDFRNDREVREFYAERVNEDPRYKRYKSEILECKTLEEAQIRAMNVDLDAVPTKTKKSKKRTESATAKKTESLTAEDLAVRRLRRKGWF